MSYSAVPDDYYTVAEFEHLERDAPDGERWELIRGRIVRMMTGGTIAHNRLVRNVARALEAGLRANGSPCDVFTENVKYEDDLQDSAVYPDVIVTCEPLKNEATKIISPVILVEVVSKSSALRDRREKLAIYAHTPSLQHYLVVEQASPIVEFWSRQTGGNDDDWTARRIEGLQAMLTIPAFDLTLSMAEIYDRVFEAGT